MGALSCSLTATLISHGRTSPSSRAVPDPPAIPDPYDPLGVSSAGRAPTSLSRFSGITEPLTAYDPGCDVLATASPGVAIAEALSRVGRPILLGNSARAWLSRHRQTARGGTRDATLSNLLETARMAHNPRSSCADRASGLTCPRTRRSRPWRPGARARVAGRRARRPRRDRAETRLDGARRSRDL